MTIEEARKVATIVREAMLAGGQGVHPWTLQGATHRLGVAFPEFEWASRLPAEILVFEPTVDNSAAGSETARREP